MPTKYICITIFLGVCFSMVFTLSSPILAEEWHEFYEEAEKAIEEKKWETAISLLKKAIELGPEPGIRRKFGMWFVEYYPYLKEGQAYLAIGNQKEAYNSCKTAREKGAAPKEDVDECLEQTAKWATDEDDVFARGKPVRLDPDTKQRSENVYAVIIGIDKYQDERIPTLQYAVKDAQGLYGILTNPDHRGVKHDHIKLLLGQEATYQNIKHAVGTWLRQQAGEEDTVIIYYSGHGAPEGEETYWVTYNANIDDLYSTALNNNEIDDMLGRITSKRVITFIDSCYSEATVKRKDQTKYAVTRIALEKFTGEGRVVISASDGKQRSVELDEYQHGAFTYHLLEGLKREADKNKDGVVVVDEIWDHVKDRVTAAARKVGNPQTPVLQGRISAGIPLTMVVPKTPEEKFTELLKQGIIQQDQYDCALKILKSGESNDWIDALMSGEISEEFFGRKFQCDSQ